MYLSSRLTTSHICFHVHDSTAGIICSPQNVDLFGIFCNIIQQFPIIERTLEGNSSRKLGVVGSAFDIQNGSALLTVFAPTNKAFERLVLPDNINIMNYNDFTMEEKDVVRIIVNNHIYGNGMAKSFDDLVCNDRIKMHNGQYTQTRCYTNNKSITQKFQIGSASSAFGEDNDDAVLSLYAPKIIGRDVLARNGIVHAVNNVIVPNLEGFVSR